MANSMTGQPSSKDGQVFSLTSLTYFSNCYHSKYPINLIHWTINPNNLCIDEAKFHDTKGFPKDN